MGWIDNNTMELPFQTGSDTSEIAASAIEPSAERLRERVHRFLLDCGTRGATDEEIQMGTGLRVSTQVPRRRELVLAGHVIDTGFRRQTVKLRPAVVWGATSVLSPENRGPYRNLAAENKELRETVRKLTAYLDNCIIKVLGNFRCKDCAAVFDANQVLYHANGTLCCPACHASKVECT